MTLSMRNIKPRWGHLVALSFVLLVALLFLPERAEAQGSVNVTVTTPGGSPPSGTAVASGRGSSGRCALRAGRCTIRGLRPGTYTVTVSSPGRSAMRRSVRVNAGPAQVRFTAPAPANSRRRASPMHAVGSSHRPPSGSSTNIGSGSRIVVQGTVTTSRGTPASGTIEVRRNGRSIGSVRITSGRYSIYDLSPGSYQLVLRSSGSASQNRNVTVGPRPLTINFVASASSAADSSGSVRVRGPLGTASPAGSSSRNLASGSRLVVQGTATTRRGTPAVGTIEVRRGGSLIGTSSVTSGRFSIYDLASGSYEISLRTSSGVVARRTVTVGSSPVTLTLVAP